MTDTQKHDEKGGRIIGKYNSYHPVNYGKPEKYELTQNVDDLTTVVDMSIQSLKRGVIKYPKTAEGLEMFKNNALAYFQYINEANERDVDQRVFPDTEGLCIYLGISRKTLASYENSRSDEWTETIELIKTAIGSAKKQLSSSFKIPPVLAIFDLANNHGYKNASEFKIETSDTKSKQELPTLTPEEIAADYGLNWNEETETWE